VDFMKLAIVTGGSLGVGFETARRLARGGYDILIGSRDPGAGLSARERLVAEFPNRDIRWEPLDLANSESIDRFSGQVERFDILVNNAGAKVLPRYVETNLGIEYHFGVNSVGHFSLVSKLLPRSQEGFRIVTVSSIVARFAPKSLGPSGSAATYKPSDSYSASKLSNLLFALELDDRLGGRGKSIAAHPGFARAEPYGTRLTRFAEYALAQSAASGSKPIFEACIAKNPPKYLAPKILELWGSPAIGKLPRQVSKEAMKENWEILERLAGHKLL
jgi:NAD(P)-dependent dehydrogenase (short-subunit alcohol dehydrogenase family)